MPENPLQRIIIPSKSDNAKGEKLSPGVSEQTEQELENKSRHLAAKQGRPVGAC